jgi:hypothetical protein
MMEKVLKRWNLSDFLAKKMVLEGGICPLKIGGTVLKKGKFCAYWGKLYC